MGRENVTVLVSVISVKLVYMAHNVIQTVLSNVIMGSVTDRMVCANLVKMDGIVTCVVNRAQKTVKIGSAI